MKEEAVSDWNEGKIETELVPGREENEKLRMWRKWHRPEPWSSRGRGRGMRFGEMETEASPDWHFPELGVPGAGGRAGVRGGQLCRQERGGPAAAAASAWPVPSSPSRTSAPASCFSSDRAPSAGKVETP